MKTLLNSSCPSSPPAENCELCPRLVEYRQQNQRQYPHFFNGAVPSFGALDAKLLIVGLAPGLKGANATGIPFTGDFAGDVLYPALARQGLMVDGSWLMDQPPSEFFRSNNQQPSADNYQLNNTRITNAVRCLPPENKPITAEVNQCNPFLRQEINSMENLKVVLTLGGVSHKAVIKALGMKQSAHTFAHGAVHHKPDANYKILNSYHTSRYNMNTKRLTFEMFDEVMVKALQLMAT